MLDVINTGRGHTKGCGHWVDLTLSTQWAWHKVNGAIVDLMGTSQSCCCPTHVLDIIDYGIKKLMHSLFLCTYVLSCNKYHHVVSIGSKLCMFIT